MLQKSNIDRKIGKLRPQAASWPSALNAGVIRDAHSKRCYAQFNNDRKKSLKHMLEASLDRLGGSLAFLE